MGDKSRDRKLNQEVVYCYDLEFRFLGEFIFYVKNDGVLDQVFNNGDMRSG